MTESTHWGSMLQGFLIGAQPLKDVYASIIAPEICLNHGEYCTTSMFVLDTYFVYRDINSWRSVGHGLAVTFLAPARRRFMRDQDPGWISIPRLVNSVFNSTRTESSCNVDQDKPRNLRRLSNTL